jgi:hypothetical protein
LGFFGALLGDPRGGGEEGGNNSVVLGEFYCVRADFSGLVANGGGGGSP